MRSNNTFTELRKLSWEQMSVRSHDYKRVITLVLLSGLITGKVTLGKVLLVLETFVLKLLGQTASMDTKFRGLPILFLDLLF